MELLDLNSHAPEEYEGKIVGCNGCPYVIGSNLGLGAERTAHKLINVQSMLCLHVIKLWHDNEESEYAVKTHARAISVLRRDSELREVIPVSLYFRGHGGFFELQRFINESGETDAVSNYVREADHFMNNADYARAIPVYQRAVDSFPSHTIILHKLAACQAGLHDYREAYRTEGRVVETEPNYIPYRGAQITFAVKSGDLQQGMNLFAEMKSLFPYVPDYDELGMSLYLACGKPQEAEQLSAAGRLSDSEMKKVQEAKNVVRAAKDRLLRKD